MTIYDYVVYGYISGACMVMASYNEVSMRDANLHVYQR